VIASPRSGRNGTRDIAPSKSAMNVEPSHPPYRLRDWRGLISARARLRWGHHAWTPILRSTAEQVWPENLPDILARIGVWPVSSNW